MRARLQTTGIVVLATLTGCAGAQDTESPTGPELAVQPNEDFTLAVGETALLESSDLAVRLLEVADDSRCPVDVVCVWAGDAVAAIEVVNDGVEYAFGLHVNPGEATGPGSVEVGGYCLDLEAMAPQPHAEVPIAQNDYRVTFRFRPARSSL